VRCNIRESATIKVCVLAVVGFSCGIDVTVQVILNGRPLIPGTGKIVAESSRASHPSDFGRSSLCTAHCCDIWAGARELRSELRSFLSVVGLAWSANAYIALTRYKDNIERLCKIEGF
jgi:hypothetical protein